MDLAKLLLGKILVTNFAEGMTSGQIVETEAYLAPQDKASHAYNNKRTERTSVMYNAGGVAYVYLCYGIHHLFNVVTGPVNLPHAVLIRALMPLDNVELMQKRRNISKLKKLCAGPGILSKSMGIIAAYSGLSLTERHAKIWIEDRGINIDHKDIIASPRVGVGYAEECATWPWRFRIKKNEFTSKAK